VDNFLGIKLHQFEIVWIKQTKPATLPGATGGKVHRWMDGHCLKDSHIQYYNFLKR